MNQYESLGTDFTTFDLSLGAFLTTAGFTLEHLDRSEPKKVAFCFRRNDQLDVAIQNYWSGLQTVEPKSYFAAIRDLKSQIYSR